MTRTKKSWREKLDDSKDLPRVAEITGPMSRRWGEGTLVIPAPREVDAIMNQVPKGKLITIDGIRQRLAQTHGTTMACPMATGIFAWIAAHAAEEEEQAGRKRVTPYWRTLKARGQLNPKYPGGLAHQRARLEAEGHRVVEKGKRFVVADYETALVGE